MCALYICISAYISPYIYIYIHYSFYSYKKYSFNLLILTPSAYHDISLDKCYVIELNTTIVLPPRNFWELLMNVKRGTYLPQTYIIQEEMVVTEHVRDKEALGSFIYHLCNGKDTYRLRRRSTRRRINKRGGKNCNAIRHFENTFVVETLICGVV